MPQINTNFPNVQIQGQGTPQLPGSVLGQIGGISGQGLQQVGQVLQRQENASHIAEAYRTGEDFNQSLTGELFALSQQPLSARDKSQLVEERIAKVQKDFEERASRLNPRGKQVFAQLSTSTTNRARAAQFMNYQKLIQQETIADLGFAKDEIVSRSATRGLGIEQSRTNDDKDQPSLADDLRQIDLQAGADQVEVELPDIIDQDVMLREKQDAQRRALEIEAVRQGLIQDVNELVSLYNDPSVQSQLGGPSGARVALRSALEEMTQARLLLSISKDPLGAIERIDEGSFQVPKIRVKADGTTEVSLGTPSNPVQFEAALRAKAQEVLAAQSAARSFRIAENEFIRKETKRNVDNVLVGKMLRGENIEEELGDQGFVDALGGERALTLSNKNNELVKQRISGASDIDAQEAKITLGLELSDRTQADDAFERRILDVLTMDLPTGVKQELGSIIQTERQFRAGKSDDQFEKLVSDGKALIRKIFPDPVFDFGEGSALKALSASARYEYQLLVRQNPPRPMSKQEWATLALRQVVEPKLEAAGDALLEQQRIFGRVLQRYTGTGVDPFYAIENDTSLDPSTKQLYKFMWESTVAQIRGGLTDKELAAAIEGGKRQITEDEANTIYPKVEKRGLSLKERFDKAMEKATEFLKNVTPFGDGETNGGSTNSSSAPSSGATNKQ